MLPFKRNKVDISKLNPAEKKLFEKYGIPGAIPARKREQDRKYFDSGDYALSKAGVAPQSLVGTAIPNPENIPHASSSGSSHNNGLKSTSISPTNSTSPVISGLANDENTIPGQLTGSGDETVPECNRKYFDSGDHARSKAGVVPQSLVGTAIQNPENIAIDSIPHASSSGSIDNNEQKPTSISPTNSTSPVVFGLANDENTLGQSAGSGDETVPECEQPGSVEKIVPDHEQAM